MKLGKDMLAKLRATMHLDSEQGAVDFAATGAHGLQLHRAPAGHAAVDLLDFPEGSADEPVQRAAMSEELCAQSPGQLHAVVEEPEEVEAPHSSSTC